MSEELEALNTLEDFHNMNDWEVCSDTLKHVEKAMKTLRQALQPDKHTVECSCGRKFTTTQKMTMAMSDKLDVIIEKLEEVLNDG